MFEGKTVLVTGGTGSFGTAFVKFTLAKYKPEKIIIFSRDEMKQWQMSQLYSDERRVKFILGDVRDAQSVRRAVRGVDYVVHAAAAKIVPLAEYNPFDCTNTNILGAMNLIDACYEAGVEKVVSLSTDKASAPANLYGATKLVSDKLFISGNVSAEKSGTKFSVVRYGNVMGSRGSVIPVFLKARETGVLPITNASMTRFMITLEEGIELVWQAFADMIGGEIYVRKIPSMSVDQIAEAVAPGLARKIIGIRPGEKLHEQMISSDESDYTFEYDLFYKVLPTINDWYRDPARIGSGKKVEPGFTYASESNPNWMKVVDLRNWIDGNKHLIGGF